MRESNTESSGLGVTDELLLSAGASGDSASQASSLSGKPLSARIDLFKVDQKTLIADFRAQLADRLEQKGIDSSGEMQLAIGADGRVLVAANHPQKKEIEALFREEPQLRNQFAQISAQESLQRAAREAIEFQAAYRSDPFQAVQEFAYLFERSHLPKTPLFISI